MVKFEHMGLDYVWLRHINHQLANISPRFMGQPDFHLHGGIGPAGVQQRIWAVEVSFRIPPRYCCYPHDGHGWFVKHPRWGGHGRFMAGESHMNSSLWCLFLFRFFCNTLVSVLRNVVPGWHTAASGTNPYFSVVSTRNIISRPH